ncbi:MAG TPA: hypothetical protein VI603_09765 [Saprospiraceae bacterium]|nr:hypothetical protein [Saprospiraceae bacterium]
MNHFRFEGGLKTTLLILIAIGVISLVITYMGDNPDMQYPRFWSNILHNSVFFTGIAILSLFFMCACITSWAGWHTLFKRVWEAYSLFLIPGLVLMLCIGIGAWGGWHHLYEWTNTEIVENDEVLKGKSGFLNPRWYIYGTVIIGGLWLLIATRLRSLSLTEDRIGDVSFTQHHKMRIWAAAGLPLIGFGSAALIWLWVMSVDPHWYSTLFAWYNGASLFIAMIALTILSLYFLKGRGYYRQVTVEHIHDLGKYLFAISIFWTYLWFSQYMLIWYSNVGEETIYFKQRIDEYPVWFYGNLIVNFGLPFLILMRNDTKRKLGSLAFVSLVVFLGHWMDFFLMLKPGIWNAVSHGAHTDEHVVTFIPGFTLPGFLEFGTMLGFLGLFLFFFFTVLSRAQLIPGNDPYLAESVHHHV